MTKILQINAAQDKMDLGQVNFMYFIWSILLENYDATGEV